eukprot:746977_1
MGEGALDSEYRGIIPRVCEDLFAFARASELDYTVEVSYLEIYAEKITDLLAPAGSVGSSGLRVREHPKTGPYVEDLSLLAVRSYAEIKQIMEDGNKVRRVAATQMNDVSSRSHAVFTVIFKQTRTDPVSKARIKTTSRIELVDLAGSERADTAGVCGDRLREMSSINTSLTILGRVISTLAESQAEESDMYIPYRDSKLTWLLKESLGGNSKTIMIACVSPSALNFEETLSTLRYASRAKQIRTAAVVNEDRSKALVKELRQDIEALKGQLMATLARSSGQSQEIDRLREKYVETQQLVDNLNMSWEERLELSKRVFEKHNEALRHQARFYRSPSIHKSRAWSMTIGTLNTPNFQ